MRNSILEKGENYGDEELVSVVLSISTLTPFSIARRRTASSSKKKKNGQRKPKELLEDMI
ncbi:hypothetical protein CUMW_223540 [Citrus unshiu]|uniref:Uncharacterized protein n=1 Tax=Citrus unshiu TaxID=55188 RepID=A0A2H5QEW0_CITUN|nr:hypothetical protein CUMW_223540 [Citrus unshiu]